MAAFKANDDEDIEAFRIKYLGTKGLVKSVMGEMKHVPAEQKKEAGQILNSFKTFAEEQFEQLKNGTIQADSANTKDAVDWSLPGDPVTVGTRHPLSIVRNQIVDILEFL